LGFVLNRDSKGSLDPDGVCAAAGRTAARKRRRAAGVRVRAAGVRREL
jgi:hypothetical protein